MQRARIDRAAGGRAGRCTCWRNSSASPSSSISARADRCHRRRRPRRGCRPSSASAPERCGRRALDILGGERPQHQAAAARADGRQHAARRMADQQKQRARRRLLQHLEQRIGAGAVELVDRIDDGDAPAALARGRAEERHACAGHRRPRMSGAQLAVLSLSDALQHQQIAVRLRRRCGAPPDGRRRPRAIVAVLHRRRRRIGMRQHEARHPIGQRRLADAALAADQPGMRHAPAAIGVEQRLLGLGMAEQVAASARGCGTRCRRRCRRRSRRASRVVLELHRRGRRIEPLDHDAPDLRRRPRPCDVGGVDQDAALRLVRRQRAGSRRAAFRGTRAPRPRSGRRRPRRGAVPARAQALLGRHVEDEGQVGPGVADGDPLQRADQPRIDVAERRPDRRGSNRRSGRRSPSGRARAPAGSAWSR